MFTANITIHAEGAESQSFECLIGLDTKDRLIIRGKAPLIQSEFYRNNYRKLKDTGNKLMYSVDKSNAKRVDALIADMSRSIHGILNELQDIPRISVNKSNLINNDVVAKQQTKWIIYIGGILHKDISIHWMRNPEVVDWVYCKNNIITVDSFKYKGTDDNKNVYVSNDLINWYLKTGCNNKDEDLPKSNKTNKMKASDVAEDLINNINDNLKNIIENNNDSDDHKENEKENNNELNNESNNMDKSQSNDEAVNNPQKDPFEEMNTDVTQIEPKIPVNTKDAVHVFIKWMIQQDPINPSTHRPVHYKIICDLIQKLSEQFLLISKCMFGDYYYFEVTEKELKNMIHNLIFDNPSTKDHFTALNITYNEAKNGCTVKDRYEDSEPKVTFCSRYGGPAWQNDFIDLDALCNNVTRELTNISIPKAE